MKKIKTIKKRKPYFKTFLGGIIAFVLTFTTSYSLSLSFETKQYRPDKPKFIIAETCPINQYYQETSKISFEDLKNYVFVSIILQKELELSPGTASTAILNAENSENNFDYKNCKPIPLHNCETLYHLKQDWQKFHIHASTLPQLEALETQCKS